MLQVHNSAVDAVSLYAPCSDSPVRQDPRLRNIPHGPCLSLRHVPAGIDVPDYKACLCAVPELVFRFTPPLPALGEMSCLEFPKS